MKKITKEELIEKIIKECAADGEPVTKEEAEEMAEMEIKAGEIELVEKGPKPSNEKRPPRGPYQKKPDPDRDSLMVTLKTTLEGLGVAYEQKGTNELEFVFGSSPFTLKLVKHRLPKQGGLAFTQ